MSIKVTERMKSVFRDIRDHFRSPVLVVRSSIKNGRRPKEALLCYITSPFLRPSVDFKHSNIQEATIIAAIIAAKGYNVSVIDYRSKCLLDYESYDLLFGFGDIFERSFSQKFSGKRIFYSTGACNVFNGRAESARIKYLYNRKGVLTYPKRVTDRLWVLSEELSDGIICIGNNWTVSTFEKRNKLIFPIPVSYLPHIDIHRLSNDYSKKRGGFLWFGSEGAVHKGLDLALDAMEMLDNEAELHICGPLSKEKDFLKIYEEYLYGNRQNIHFHGFVDVRSALMREVVEQCGYVLLPSCAEGMASSVITCMYAGLVPMVTEECGIDINNGIKIEDGRPEAIAQAMEIALSVTSDELESKSIATREYVKKNHSTDKFYTEMKKAISEILGAEENE